MNRWTIRDLLASFLLFLPLVTTLLGRVLQMCSWCVRGIPSESLLVLICPPISSARQCAFLSDSISHRWQAKQLLDCQCREGSVGAGDIGPSDGRSIIPLLSLFSFYFRFYFAVRQSVDGGRSLFISLFRNVSLSLPHTPHAAHRLPPN